jgi:hypothetical protein
MEDAMAEPSTGSVLDAVGKRAKAFGKGMSGLAGGDSGGDDESSSKLQSFKRGGKVKKTGLAKVHKGERVLTKKQQRKREGRK